MAGKPTPGHRMGTPVMGYHVNCECGWHSCDHYGRGARSQAVGEWHSHIDKMHAADPAAAPKAYAEGWNAWTPAETYPSNPYKHGSANYRLWLNGIVTRRIKEG